MSLLPRDSDALQTVMHDVSHLLHTVLCAQRALMSTQQISSAQLLQTFCDDLQDVHEEFTAKMNVVLQTSGTQDPDYEAEQELAQVRRSVLRYLSIG